MRTYKRLELMIEAFDLLSASRPDVQLIVAGGDHPQATGYTESMKQQCAGNPRIEFLGYVPEDALPDLFQSSSVAVMPYSSSTGCSGVAHLACAYGVPIVCADLLDFRQMAQAEELAIDFSRLEAHWGSRTSDRVLRNSEKQHSIADEDFATALRMTMPMSSRSICGISSSGERVSFSESMLHGYGVCRARFLEIVTSSPDDPEFFSWRAARPCCTRRATVDPRLASH